MIKTGSVLLLSLYLTGCAPAGTGQYQTIMDIVTAAN